MARENGVKVVAGLIRRRDGKILICLRPDHLDQGGLWEFPGGKREKGEGRFDALRRELQEELGIDIKFALPLLRLIHKYPTKTVDLDIWEISQWHGSATGREGQQIEWVTSSDLNRYEFPAANKAIISAARLPRVISMMPDVANIGTTFLSQLEGWLIAGIRCFIFVNQHLMSNVDKRILIQIGRLLGKFDAKIINDQRLEIAASDSDSDARSLRKNLTCHLDCDNFLGHFCRTSADLDQAAHMGAELVLIGPVGSANSGIGNTAIGWSEAKQMVAKTVIPAFAFGGLQSQDVSRAITAGCQGIVLPASVWLSNPTEVMNFLASTISAIGVTGD